MSPVSPVFYTVVTVIETYPVLRPRLQALITYILSQARAGNPIHRYLVMNDRISLTIGKFDLILRHHLISCKKNIFLVSVLIFLSVGHFALSDLCNNFAKEKRTLFHFVRNLLTSFLIKFDVFLESMFF